MRTSLDNAEERLVGPGVRRLAAASPGDGPIHGLADLVPACRQRGAMIQAHGHIGAQRLLDGYGALGCQFQEPAIDVRPEGHSVVSDPVPGRQAEDLEPTRIGQDRAVPSHERVQAAERGDGLLAGPEGQVIRVGQEHARAGGAELVGSQALDRRLCSDRHERRGLDRAVRGLEPAQPCGRGAIPGQGGEPHRTARHGPTGSL